MPENAPDSVAGAGLRISRLLFVRRDRIMRRLREKRALSREFTENCARVIYIRALTSSLSAKFSKMYRLPHIEAMFKSWVTTITVLSFAISSIVF